MKGKKTGTLHLKLMLPKSNYPACQSCSAVLCVEKVWRKNATLWTMLRISIFRARSSTNVPAAEKSWSPKKPWTTMWGHTKMYDETKTNIENKLLHIANLLDAWGLEQSGAFSCHFMMMLKGLKIYEPRKCEFWPLEVKTGNILALTTLLVDKDVSGRGTSNSCNKQTQ